MKKVFLVFVYFVPFVVSPLAFVKKRLGALRGLLFKSRVRLQPMSIAVFEQEVTEVRQEN